MSGTCKCEDVPLQCDHCSLKYKAFRSPDVPSFDETYRAMFAASVAAVEENNDYNRPALRRHGILGRMHEAKIRAWREHLHWCHEGAKEAESLAEDVPF